MIIKEDKLFIPIYNYKGRLVLTDNVLEFLNAENFNLEGLTKHTHAVVYDTHEVEECDYSFIIVLSTHKNNDWSIIVHECFHIVCMIMKTVGIKLDDSSEEAYAYLIGYVFRLLYNKIVALKQERLEEENETGTERKEITATGAGNTTMEKCWRSGNKSR